MTLFSPAVVGAVLLAVLSTLADYVWFLGIPGHQVSSGLIHGGVLFAALGGYLGWRKGKLGAGVFGGVLSGMVAAGSFYALAPLGGYSMMLVSWLLLWIMLVALQTYADGQLDLIRAITHGTVTAIVAAVGFAVVLFELYRHWPPATFPAAKHFVAWSMAYVPGLYVLLQPRKS